MNNTSFALAKPNQTLILPDDETEDEPAPVLNFEQYGFRLLESQSSLYEIPIAMGIETIGELSVSNLETVTKALFSLKFGEQWVYGDTVNLFRNHPRILEQLAPIAGKAINTLRNWSTTAYTYDVIPLASRQDKIIDMVLRDGQYMLGGAHIGRFRHQGLDYSHMVACNALNKGDLLDIRAVVLTKALADGMSGSELKLFKETRLKEYAKQGSRATQEYLAKESKKRHAVSTNFSKSVETVTFDIPQGTSYTEIMKLFRSHAKKIAIHAQDSDLSVKTKVAR